MGKAVLSIQNFNVAEKRKLQRLEEDLPFCIQEARKQAEVIEIMIDPSGKIFSDRLGTGIEQIGTILPSEAEALCKVIASLMDGALTKEQPIFEGEFPFSGERIAIAIPPVTSAATLSIRKHASQVYTLEDYVLAGSLTEIQKSSIEQWIQDRKNILVVGGTGSGKTTFINGLIAKIISIHPQHRLVILEDTVELQCLAESYIQMRSTETVSLQTLVKTTLRHRPDRIIVGEVRGKEAFDLLTSWSTGHPGGVASLHANSALGAFPRLEQLNQIAVQTPLKALIAEAIDAIIYLEKTTEGRKVKELLEVRGLTSAGQYDTVSIF